MLNSNQFSVLQQENVSPEADRLKRAYKSISKLAEADVIRLSVVSRGILMKGLDHAAAQSLQRAMQAEGVAAVVIPENELPKLPVARFLQRTELSPAAFSHYDLMARPTPIAWQDIALVAAASVRHFEIGTYLTASTAMKFSMVSGVKKEQVRETAHKVESGELILLEIILADGATRFQIDAAKFPFKYLIDRPDFSTTQRFIWLTREICRQATRATLNYGARCLHEGQDEVPAYRTRQSFLDEIIWFLWHSKNGSAAATP